MKKLTLCLTSLIMFFVLFSISASAIDDDIVYLGDCGENITYTIYEDGKLVLNGNGNMTKYDSPFLFPWYQYHSLIKGVLIDDGITNISDYAFSYEYNNLETVTIADSVTDIGKSAFDNCTKLTKVVIGSGVVNIGESAFFGCEKLTTIVLPEGICVIGSEAFRACLNLKSINLPNTLKKIGNYAFLGCSSLQSLEIPNSISSISYYSFGGCSSIKSVIIPDNITNISPWAFVDCTGLEKITIGKNVKSIGEYAFYNCSNLKNVDIPNGVISIGNYAFYWCTSLKTITIPTTVTSIGDAVFECCYNFTDIYYLGSKTQWEKINISSVENSYLNNATKHYNTSQEKTNICSHEYGNAVVTKKATISENGSKTYTCKTCGYVKKSTIYRVGSVSLSKSSYTYDGTVKKPTVLVKDYKGNTLKKNTDYTVKYDSGRKNIGNYKVTVTFKNNYSGKKVLSFDIVLGKTSKISASPSSNAITLKWNSVKNATGYTVYRKLDGKWKSIKVTTSTSFKVTGLSAGTKYNFAIKAYRKENNKTIWASSYTTISTATRPSLPSKVTASSREINYITLSWTKSTGATGYRIYRYVDKKWKEIKTTTATSYKVTGLSTGTEYIFAVKPYIKTESGNVWASSYTKLAVTTKLQSPELKASSTSKGKATLSWTDIKGESGYQVYYSTNKASSFKKYSNYKANTKKVTIPNLTSGKTYYFKVRAYKSINKSTIYSAFSDVKSVKIMSSQKPNIETTMSTKIDSNCTYVFVIVENKGNSTIRFYSEDAILMDADYSSYDRLLKLVDYDYWNKTKGKVKEVSYVDIKAGEETTLLLKVQGKSTWYDKNSTVGIKCKYDGKIYKCTINSYYGFEY